MLPSILAQEINTGLKHFLKTGFETTTPYFKGMFSRFVEEPSNLSKGPYLSLQLPFLHGTTRRDFFANFITEHPPFIHQEQAWNRLHSQRGGKSTIVATGTGSGKTECFLYPVLDHCLRHPGYAIKTIIIYPMNALATDQAKRFAKSIYASSALKGNVRVGLFVGDGEKTAHKSMGADFVITDKNVLRDSPPDILLTNYKMLDYLLMRPKDWLLWRFNKPQDLRYLIVDELHTFDGAQGTDLACLIRRLKGRLDTPDDHLIAVGTSATLGDGEGSDDLRQYAQQIFQEPFDAGAIIGESRQDRQQFLGDDLIKYQFFPPQELAQQLNPQNYATISAYIRAQYTLLFTGEQVTDPTDAQWRRTLGEQLKAHILFRNLLQLLIKQPRTLDELAGELAKTLPQGEPRELSYALLNSLCALISHARDPLVAALPLVQLRLQFWVRELRRMVTLVARTPEEIKLTFADDLKQQNDSFFLPLVQCNECHTTAWIGHQLPGQEQVKNDLRAIYNAFFNNSPETVMLLPITTGEKITKVRGMEKYLCPGCGKLQQGGELCQACGEYDLVAVFVPDNLQQKKNVLVSERNCPCCGKKNSMLVFGSRATSLASIAIHHSFATPYNDDKKLLAFSDSVQDAAHRAGFFSARTWQNNIRIAIAQAVKQHDGIALNEFYTLLPNFWQSNAHNHKAFSSIEFICQFIAPNMFWLNDYVVLEKTGKLPRDSRLADEVCRRLEWEVLAEFGYRSKIGRSLTKTGTCAMGIRQSGVFSVAEALHQPFIEQFGIRDLTLREVQHFVLGFLYYLKSKGAICHRFLKGYIESGGRTYLLNKQNSLPNFAPQSAAPMFLTDSHRYPYFDKIIAKQGESWYQQWLFKALGQNRLISEGIEVNLYSLVLDKLVTAGLMVQDEIAHGTVWGINPAQLYLTSDISVLATSHGGNELCVPKDMADLFVGMSSLEIHIQEPYVEIELREHWLADMYRSGEIERVFAAEHTGLLDRESREAVENNFIHRKKPWHPNLLSATPTLEMGIDIGDLSSVLLCSVPPAQANYLQRIGRAGRKDGNSFNLTFAVGSPHDLYFYAEPLEMMTGTVESPGVFLNASAVVERQLTAYCLDQWVRTGVDDTAIPQLMKSVLDQVETSNNSQFPYTFLDFVFTHAPELFEYFVQMFKQEFSTHTKEHLQRFLVTSSKVDGLEMRISLRLHELVRERKDLKLQVDALKRYVDAELKQPQDDVTADNIDQARRERSGLQDILRSINKKETLNFFTDEGLLPNYAFPEAGVSLRSVIYRKRNNAKDGEPNYVNEVYEYERSGAAALSELAPNNRFFAGGRRVQIEQVNISLSEVEQWRFCQSCSHAENLAGGDVHDICPRCNNGMWGDSGQLFQMLRLRQVMANTSDRESRIGDDSEDREATFYSKQMLADFPLDAIEKAWRIAGELLPFGFEYIRKSIFREMNFGEYSIATEASTVAGVEASRPGFVVCKYCGTVQQKNPKEQKHAFICKAKDKTDSANLINCLYLYREFTSEAVRILLPVSVFSGSERYLNSFIAAIQLGLKKKFGGKIDHLRMMTYDEPMAGTETKRQFLMLYDSIPGGTGYLHELLRSHTNLLDVFRLARDTMVSCSCNQDADKDGCYRCLLAYRNSYGMESTSRDAAVKLLSDILEHEDTFEEVESIHDIEVNPLFDSELEARFIDAIKRLALDGLDIQINQQVIQGKPGYFLKVNEFLYTIEPQVNLGSQQGTENACCPDFFIKSAQEAKQLKPVCVFLDGYKFHKDSAGEDSAKRLSLVQSDQYWQWSLTWQDINRFFVKSPEETRNPFAENLQAGMQPLQSGLEKFFNLSGLVKYAVRSPLEQLLLYLGQPEVSTWQQIAFVRVLGWLQQDTMFSAETQKIFMDDLIDTAPESFNQICTDSIAEQVESVAFGGLNWAGEGDLLRVMTALPESAIAKRNPALAMVNIVLEDSDSDDKSFKAAWQAFLKSYNLLQFLPKVSFTSHTAMVTGLYENMVWNYALGQQQLVGVSQSAALDILLDEVLEEYRDGVAHLGSLGLPLPTVCFELQLESGEIVAEAELAWPQQRCVGLTSDQWEQASLFKDQGWMVYCLDVDELWIQDIAEELKEKQA